MEQKQKNTVNIHQSKIHEIIYPLFADEFWKAESYSEWAEIVQGHFDLDSEQWNALLAFYEMLKG